MFPWKKKRGFLVSVCFHEQEWLRLTNKPLFPRSQMRGPSWFKTSEETHHFYTLMTVKKFAFLNNLIRLLMAAPSEKLLKCRVRIVKPVSALKIFAEARVCSDRRASLLIHMCTRTLKVKSKKGRGDADLPLNSCSDKNPAVCISFSCLLLERGRYCSQTKGSFI